MNLTLETYAVHISSKRGPGFKKLLRRFSCLLNESFSLHQIASKISEIKFDIARVKESMKEFGIKSIIQGESSTVNQNDNQLWKRQTYPVESEDCFVGKDDDLNKLVSLIVDDKQQEVISIWGMGGIGKTTIARKVYNHTDTKRYFECFAWVCITQQCQIRSVMEDVLKQLTRKTGDDLKQLTRKTGDDISNLSHTQLIEQLCQIQVTKRCMVVLDDLWELDHWIGLRKAFLVQGSNSKVLVTTRKQNIAYMGFAFELELLTIDDGWELLKKKAFPFNNIPDNFGMEEKLFQKIGKEMVRKCGYLPLVIRILGALLSKRKSMEEWESVNENINAHLYREENEIHGVLNLSYEDLPFYLKPCFLIMGQFREDERILANDLFRMWIAEGMISHESRGKDETLMDVAEAYLSELASRCLVKVELSDVGKEKYKFCQLHDAVRELCLLKGKKEGFSFHLMNYRGGEFSSLLNESLSGTKPRHLAIHFEGKMASKPVGFTVHREETCKHIRSIQFLYDIGGEKIEFQDDILDLEKFKLLRVLVFQGFRFKGRQLRGIGNLIHLRYLAFRDCELDELPSSISNLKYLHILDFFLSLDLRVPNVFKNMHRLKHLILPIYVENIGNYHLKLEGLDGLETLHYFNSTVHDLEAVIRMKKLIYINAEVYDNNSLLAIMNVGTTNWTKLRSCSLGINHGCRLITSTEDGLMILKKVFTSQILHYLSIDVPIRKLQLEEYVTEIISSRLVSLFLSDCEIEDDPMEILEKFPFLETLRLCGRAFVGEEMKCQASGFPRLKNLYFEQLPNLKKWTVEQGAMPLLSGIYFFYCPRVWR